MAFVARLSGLRAGVAPGYHSLKTHNFSSLSHALARPTTPAFARAMLGVLETKHQPGRDELVGIDAVARWVDELSPPPDFVVMKQADHMFHRRIMDLRGLLKNGVRDHLPEPDTSPPLD